MRQPVSVSNGTVEGPATSAKPQDWMCFSQRFSRVSASLVIITPESTPRLRVCGALGSTKSDGRVIWWLSTWSRGRALEDGHCSGNLADDEDSTWQIRFEKVPFKGTL
jgi:hypothetical protein